MELPFAESWKIKMVEPLRKSTREEREQWIKEANYNLFQLKSDQVYIECLTNSGTGAMSDRRHHIARHGELGDVGQVIADIRGRPAAALDEHDQRIALIFGEVIFPGLEDAQGDILAALAGENDVRRGLCQASQQGIVGDGLDGLHLGTLLSRML